MIKINIIIDNIMQDPMVVTYKLIINHIEIIYITNKNMIRIFNFDKIMSNVIVVGREVMLGTIVLYGRKLSRKRKKTPN
jgi:hypothetical protein